MRWVGSSSHQQVHAVGVPQGGKPDSVPARAGPVIYLPSFEGSCDQPEIVRLHSRAAGPPPKREETGRLRSPIWSCSGWGLPCARVHTHARWSLAPPFHPCCCEPCGAPQRYLFCGTFHRPGLTGASPHPALRLGGASCPVESGLSSRLREPGDQSPCGSDSKENVPDQRRQYKMRPQKVQQIMFRFFFTS